MGREKVLENRIKGVGYRMALPVLALIMLALTGCGIHKTEIFDESQTRETVTIEATEPASVVGGSISDKEPVVVATEGSGSNPTEQAIESGQLDQESSQENPAQESGQESVQEGLVQESGGENSSQENPGQASGESRSLQVGESQSPGQTGSAVETSKPAEESRPPVEEISWNNEWDYAGFSAIHSGSATLYRSSADNRKNYVVAVNAGHGTEGGESEYTLSHPDGTPKVTGGTNAEGAVKSISIASGTTMDDGTPESAVTLRLALILKEQLLAAGFDVLMIREEADVQLDNIARTVMANQNANCHIALHYDSGSSDKGAFYISVPDISSYRSMEPVASHWRDHDRLGSCLIKGMENHGRKIFSSGSMALDLTQTSYSTIPSVDLEVGDQASDYGSDTLNQIAEGIVDGMRSFIE